MYRSHSVAEFRIFSDIESIDSIDAGSIHSLPSFYKNSESLWPMQESETLKKIKKFRFLIGLWIENVKTLQYLKNEIFSYLEHGLEIEKIFHIAFEGNKHQFSILKLENDSDEPKFYILSDEQVGNKGTYGKINIAFKLIYLSEKKLIKINTIEPLAIKTIEPSAMVPEESGDHKQESTYPTHIAYFYFRTEYPKDFSYGKQVSTTSGKITKYISMPLFDGQTLQSYFRSVATSKIFYYDAIQIVLGIVEEIAKLHSKRLVHRDIKPANIIIGKNNAIYFVDHDLSEVIDDEPATIHAKMHSTDPVTPERKSRAKTTVNSDLYPFGLILNTMLKLVVDVPVYRLLSDIITSIQNQQLCRLTIFDIKKRILLQFPEIKLPQKPIHQFDLEDNGLGEISLSIL